MKIIELTDKCICCDSSDLARAPALLMPFVAKRVFDHEPLEITVDWGMRDLKPGMAYTLCNSLQCQKCGVLFLDYRFTDKQMASLYQGYRDAAYTRQRDHYEPGYAATVSRDFEHRHAYIADVEAWLSPHLPERPAVLDWGGDSGINTPFLGRHRLLHVYDISGVELLEGVERIHPDQFGQADYDLVVCSQVLEHVPFPLASIEQLRAALGPKTLLYLEVPHETLMREHPGSQGLAALKRHWHEHINFFTETALRCLIERADLMLLDSHVLPIDLGWRKGEVLGILARRV